MNNDVDGALVVAVDVAVPKPENYLKKKNRKNFRFVFFAKRWIEFEFTRLGVAVAIVVGVG